MLRFRYFILSKILILFISTPNYIEAQCTADFEYTHHGFIYEFQDNSTATEGDSIVSWTWNFGDGQSAVSPLVSHTYQMSDSYIVTLIISTQNGCIDTVSQTITLCNLSLNVIAGEACLDNQQEVILQISDLYGVVDSVDISLDNEPLNPGRFAIEEDLNLNLLIESSTNIRTLEISSEYSTECTERYYLSPRICENNCKIKNLTVNANRKTIVEVRDTVFFPKNKIIFLGDTILWKWTAPGNSSTSDSTSGPLSWDSGVKFLNDSFKIALPTIGVNPYYSKTRGGPNGSGMSGNIIVNCPNFKEKEIEIIVNHEATESSGYVIAVDGVINQDSIFSYDETGISTARINLAADGIEHEITVIDIENNNCYVSSSAYIPDCGGVQSCQINIDGFSANRCINDSIDITIDVRSMGTSDDGLLVFLNSEILIDTVFPNENGKISAIYRVPYSSSSDQNITVVDINDNSCMDEVSIAMPSCSESCEYSNLEITTNPPSITNLYIDNDGLGLKDIGIGYGKSIIFNWLTDKNLGIRSQNGTWDSGMRLAESIFITPVMYQDDIYEIYNQYGEIISSGTIKTKQPCEEGKIPIFISFDDDGGSAAGYSLFIDGILTSPEVPYANGPQNLVCVQVIGDDVSHNIEIRDNNDGNCSIAGDIELISCATFDCFVDISVSELDSCYNDDTRELEIEIFNPNPFPRGFGLLRNGEQIGEEEIKYDLDSTTHIIDTILSQGTIYNYTVYDIFNQMCRDSVAIEPETCITNCVLSDLELAIVDESFIQQYPDTPEIYVGCQSDSTYYIAASFIEKYSDAEQYVIFVDNEIYSTVYYNEGDGKNLVFIPILGDSSTHSIRIADMSDSACIITRDIISPECYKECILSIEEYNLGICEEDSFDLNIILNTPISDGEIAIFESGSNHEYSISGDTVQVKLRGDGEAKFFTLFEPDNTLCQDYIDFTAPYCLNCNIQYDLNQIDSCSSNDLIRYELDFSENEESQLILSINEIEQVIENSEPVEFSIISDGSSSTITLKSIVDRFCFETITIMTEDCTPVICEADFTVQIDGLQAIFTDNSNTSEPITEQNWAIPGGVTVEDVNSFTWNFVEIGIYTICHTIVTDSCSSTVCKDININPCLELQAGFGVFNEMGGTFSFTDESLGQVHAYLYDFGDGKTSNESSPTHIYDLPGSYTVCQTIYNTDFECSDTLCQDIDFVTNTADPVDNVQLDIFPNPASSTQSLTITSSIPMKGYEIFSSNGTLIQAADFIVGMDKVTLRVGEHSFDGLLIINIKTDKGMFVRKIVRNL